MKYSAFNSKVLTLFLFAALLVNNSCRRILHEERPMPNITTKSKFFDVPENVDPLIKVLADKIYRQNEQYHFIDDLVKRVGYPVWDKSLIVTNQGSRHATARVMDDSITLVYVPFAIDSLQLVKATLLVEVSPNDSLFRMVNDWEYKRFGFDSTSNYVWKAKNVFHLFSRFQSAIYGDSIFQILDGRIFGGDSSWYPKIKFSGNITQGRLSTLQPLTVCDLTYILVSCAGRTSRIAPAVGCFVPSGYLCTTYWIEINPSGGEMPPPPGGGGGSGGGNEPPTWPYACVPDQNSLPRMSDGEPCPGPTGWHPAFEQPNELGYYNSRIARLANYLDSLNFGMIECDSLNIFPLDPVTGFGKMYQSIAQHTPHDSVMGRIDSIRTVFPNFVVDNYYLQSLQDAYGAVVNCDFFRLGFNSYLQGLPQQAFWNISERILMISYRLV